MTITKVITEIKNVTIDVPYFSRDADFHYVVLSEYEAIKVKYREYSEGITISAVISYNDWVEDALNGEPITRKEFEDVYEKANDFLSEQFEGMRDKIDSLKSEAA